MFAGGFRTTSHREEYLGALSRAGAAFEGVERMSMEVDGETITEEGSDDALEPVSSPTDGAESGGGNNTLYYIVGGVLGGALLLLIVGTMFYRAGRQSRDMHGREGGHCGGDNRHILHSQRVRHFR